LVGHFVAKRAAVPNAHQFKILADVADLQNVQLNLVFLNVQGRGSNKINSAGNVFVIPINRGVADRLHAGEFPINYKFISYKEWINSLASTHSPPLGISPESSISSSLLNFPAFSLPSRKYSKKSTNLFGLTK